MRRRILHVILAVFVILHSTARALPDEEQGSSISIISSVDRTTCTIGDLLSYTVVVSYAESLRVEMPGLGANLGGFEIRDYNVYDDKKKDGLIHSQVDYVISTFLTGEFKIPPLSVRYFTPSDSIGNILATETIDITVKSVKPSEAGDIKDVKPPLDIPRNLWLLLRWIGLGIFMAALAAVAVILYLRRRAGKALIPLREAPPRPPHEIALEALERLKSSDLLAKGDVKQFYIELSEIIRRYIGGRYFVVAMEMTTTEVLDGLANIDLKEEVFNAFRHFFYQCDMVKFAKFRPGEKVHESMVVLAGDLINRTSVILNGEPVDGSVSEEPQSAAGEVGEDTEGDGEKVEEV